MHLRILSIFCMSLAPKIKYLSSDLWEECKELVNVILQGALHRLVYKAEEQNDIFVTYFESRFL